MGHEGGDARLIVRDGSPVAGQPPRDIKRVMFHESCVTRCSRR